MTIITLPHKTRFAGAGQSIATSISRALSRCWPVFLLISVAFIVSLPALRSDCIDDLDSAHHIMDGFFFRDAMTSLPLRHPLAFSLAYYKQYPALGFIFWPPFYPLVEGVFFLVGGLSIFVAKLCLFAFTAMLALFAYLAGRATLSRAFGACAALLILLTPSIYALTRMIMLEVPVLALAFLAIYLYRRLVGSEQVTWGRLILLVLACAAAVYTKQTIVFLLPALGLDLIVNHRRLLRDKRVWGAMLALILILLPLAVFTLNVGAVGMEQAFGTDKSVIYGFHPPDRWSIEGWTYYLQLLPRMLNPVVLILGIGAVLFAIVNRTFLRSQVLWFGWVGFWWLTFSWFLNKQPRYAALWVPACVMLGIAFLAEAASWRKLPRFLPLVVIVTAILLGIREDTPIKPHGFQGMDRIVAATLRSEPKGNIIYFGNLRQLFVPYVRMQDTSRQVHVLQGEKLISATTDIAVLCREYRAAYVIMESDVSAATDSPQERVNGGQAFHRIMNASIGTGRSSVPILVFAYTGVMDTTMRPIPLRPRLVTQKVANALQQ